MPLTAANSPRGHCARPHTAPRSPVHHHHDEIPSTTAAAPHGILTSPLPSPPQVLRRKDGPALPTTPPWRRWNMQVNASHATLVSLARPEPPLATPTRRRHTSQSGILDPDQQQAQHHGRNPRGHSGRAHRQPSSSLAAPRRPLTHAHSRPQCPGMIGPPPSTREPPSPLPAATGQHPASARHHSRADASRPMAHIAAKPRCRLVQPPPRTRRGSAVARAPAARGCVVATKGTIGEYPAEVAT